MSTTYLRNKGVSMVELLIAMGIGLFLIATFTAVYLAQIQTYKSGTSQSMIQNAENAITGIVMPLIRQAGFTGCATMDETLSNLVAGGSPPLGTLGTAATTFMGYNANTAVPQRNAGNSNSASDWTPSLDPNLVGKVLAGSDVIVLLGPKQGYDPIAVTSIAANRNSFDVQSLGNVGNGQNGVAALGNFGAVSDCLKSVIFRINNVDGNTVMHTNAQNGALTNSNQYFSVNFPIGAQFIPMQQVAFFVAQGLGNQSSLMMATYSASGWTVQPIVPGVQTMKVMYGTGTNGTVTKYVKANAVADWSKVYAVRLGFIIEGQAGSGGANAVNPTQFNVLGTSVTVPADNRLRHVFEMTINVRNALS